MSHEPTASDLPQPHQPPMPAPVDPFGGFCVGYLPVFEEKRLHPATIIVSVARFLKSIGLLFAIAVFARASGRRADTVEIIATLLGGLSIAGAVLKYVSFRYSIRDGALFVTSGIILRQHRTIPLERIQNINVKQDLVHRMLGVADVRIETASGGDAEAELSAVSLTEAQALRSALANRHVQIVDAESRPADVVYRASLTQLVLAGATQNRLGTLLAGVVGLMFYINQFSGDHFVRFDKVFERISSRYSMPGWINIVLIGIGVLMVGWLTSIALTVFGRFGFELTRSHGQLQRSYGLLTKHQSIFPVERVQVLRIVSPVFQRWIGLCRIMGETAGSFREGKKQENGANELCPILYRSQADVMCRLVVANFALDSIRFESIHPLGRTRAMVRTFAALAILAGLAGWLLSTWALLSLIALPIVAWAYAWLYFRSVGYAVTDEHLVIRHGIWTHLIEVVPLSKVQASFVRQSPLQARLGLASFEVLTAGSTFGRSVSVSDLGKEVALTVQEMVARRA